jgi:hypothetical protein
MKNNLTKSHFVTIYGRPLSSGSVNHMMADVAWAAIPT